MVTRRASTMDGRVDARVTPSSLILARDLPLLLQHARRVTADVDSRRGIAYAAVSGEISEMLPVTDLSGKVSSHAEQVSTALRREAAAREQLSDFLEHLELSTVKRYSDFPGQHSQESLYSDFIW